MDELTDEQKIIIAEAQKTFFDLKNKNVTLNDDQMDLIFGQARSMNGWQDKEAVSYTHLTLPTKRIV